MVGDRAFGSVLRLLARHAYLVGAWACAHFALPIHALATLGRSERGALPIHAVATLGRLERGALPIHAVATLGRSERGALPIHALRSLRTIGAQRAVRVINTRCKWKR